jgi:hypothetical protein
VSGRSRPKDLRTRGRGRGVQPAPASSCRRDGVLVFLGRHELARQSDPIKPAFFFQIERNDQYDASIGLRWRFADTGIVSANALVPLNQQGLRADVIPTVEVEYAFSAPW